MLVEINNLDNGSGTNSNLDVYLCYNEKMKLFELHPYCRIDENDFAGILTEKQFVQFCEKGEIHFKVNKNQLFDRANKIY